MENTTLQNDTVFPPECEHIRLDWLEHTAPGEERTAQPRKDSGKVSALAAIMAGCTLIEVVAAVERYALGVLAQTPGKQPTISDIVRASQDEEYVTGLKDMASGLINTAYLDAFEALRARMILGHMALANADPKALALRDAKMLDAAADAE